MRVYIEKSVLSGIAAAIRKRSNSSERYYPSEMPRAIKDIPHDAEYFRQETNIVGYCDVPIICAGALEYQAVIPTLVVIMPVTS